MGMMKQAYSIVLTSLRPSTYGTEYDSGLRLLRSCCKTCLIIPKESNTKC